MQKMKMTAPSGHPLIKKMITGAGGTLVGESNAMKVGEASKMKNINAGVSPVPGMVKKSSDDLLSHITDGQEEALVEYIQEKAAGLHFGSGAHIVTRSPLPAASSTLYRYAGGLVGGAAAYGAARNDGQGVGGALGFGAIGALGGNMVGNRIGREIAHGTNVAKGHSIAALHDTHAERLKQLDKFTHETDGANHIADHLINQRKGLLTTAGGNAFETGANILKGGIAHIGDAAGNYAHPNMSKVDHYRNLVGHETADKHIADFRKKTMEEKQKISEQSGFGRGLASHWKTHGVHDAAQQYAEHGYDINTIANLKNPMGHHISRLIAQKNGVHESVFNSKDFAGGLFHSSTTKEGPYSQAQKPGIMQRLWSDEGSSGKGAAPAAKAPATNNAPAPAPVNNPAPKATPVYNPQGPGVSYQLRPKDQRRATVGEPALKPTYLGKSPPPAKNFDDALAKHNAEKRRN